MLNADDTRGAAVLAQPASVSVAAPAGKRQTAEVKFALPAPKLWDLTHPNRYVAVTTLSGGGRCRAGSLRDAFRSADRSVSIAKEGLLPQRPARRDQRVSATTATWEPWVPPSTRRAFATPDRTPPADGLQRHAHQATTPPAPELLDLCDRMGMLVLDEAFDCWAHGKNSNDYHVLFAAWHAKDLRALVRRDRNHPCVIMWSIGNEIGEQGRQGPEHRARTGRHRAKRGRHPSRDRRVRPRGRRASTASTRRSMCSATTTNTASTRTFTRRTPANRSTAARRLSTLSSRGEYFSRSTTTRQNFQVSSYVLSYPRWASPPDPELEAEAREPYVAGQFVWTGFDYLGEPTPYNNDATNLLNFSDPAQKAKMAAEMQERWASCACPRAPRTSARSIWPGFPEGSVLLLAGGVAAGPADGAPAAALELARARGAGDTGDGVYLGRRGGAVSEWQVTGPEEAGRVHLSPALGRP